MKRLLYIALFTCGLFACVDSEEDLTPSNVDKNWLIIEDNPNDEVDHRRYLLFEEFGMPIYYNDTIGKEEITYAHGGTYTRYEILQTFYRPSSLDGNMYGGHFSLCPLDRKQDLLPALDMLETTILPRLSDKMLITSILLVDTLTVSITGIGEGEPMTNYKGFNTWLIGNVFAINTMSVEERDEYGIDLLIDLTQQNNALLAEEFYAIEVIHFALKNLGTLPQVAHRGDISVVTVVAYGLHAHAFVRFRIFEDVHGSESLFAEVFTNDGYEEVKMLLILEFCHLFGKIIQFEYFVF